MKRLLISSLFSFICLGSYLLADEEEYASFTVNNSGIDSCAIGLPVITSAEQSVTQSIQQQWTMLPGEQCTKLTYYGYNPGKAITRHFEVWMGRIDDFAFFVQNLFVPKEKLQKVFDGECTIAQGGSNEEPIALLEIPFDVPFIANNYTYTCIQILSSGEATNDVFFQVCNSGKGLYTIGSSGEQQTVNDVAIDYTIKSKVNHYLGNVKNQESRPIAEAKIIMKSNYAQYETATDEAGNFDISITRDCKYDCLVMASGHTFFYESHAQFLPNLPIQYELFDKFSYKAGKRYTIMLPYEPNAEVGKYFRFDRVEGSMFIFEREFAPQANCPYVFVPSKDMQLDVNGLELSLEPICIEIDKVRFIGAYGQSFMVVSTNNASWHGENPVHDGQEMSGTYLPLQGVLYWDSMQYPGAELVFNDPTPTYRPFIEEGKVWKVGSPDLLGEIYCLDTYYFEGDTIVGNKTCKKMMCHTEWKESYGHEPWTGYVGALYEESKRTYIAHPGSQQFVLLYDFAAPVGTTIDFYDGYEQMPSSCLISKKYMSTDSIFHGMVTEIKMYDPDLQLMTSTTYSEWREGVGYNCIQNVYNLNKNTDKETLKSCTVGDEVLYYNPKPIDTITPVGGEVKKQWLDFTHTTKPRPKAPMRSSHSATEEENLTGEYSAKELFVSLQSLSGVYTIRLTDAAGNEVYCKEVQTSNVVALNTDLTQYAEGTYSLTVENAAEQYTATLTLPLIDDAVRDLPSSLLSQPSSLPTWTDLSGRRLTTPPTQKGVYIRNSRKVLIK